MNKNHSFMKGMRVVSTPKLSAIVLALASTTATAGVILDQTPLSVGEPPAPNILLLLDDSGSMQWPYMPDAVPSFSGRVSNPLASYLTYTLNTTYYNPLTTYEPWMNPDGTLMPNANYHNVSNHDRVLNPGGTYWYDTYYNSAVMSLLGSGVNKALTFRNLSDDDWVFHAKIDPNGSNNAASNFNAYVLNKGEPATARRCSPGVPSYGVPANSRPSSLSNCSSISSFSWSDGSGAPPITRTIEQERQNFANWYHYYRTRTKMARASLTHAFASLGPGFRVGFHTINQGAILDIPTTGSFAVGGVNRTNWFSAITGSGAGGGTPLRRALDRAGKYYSQTNDDGPWGPPMGVNNEHLSCRRSYTILTSDGFWNDSITGINNADGTSGTTITHANGTQSYTYVAKPPFKDDSINTLADVAMKYWKEDLRPDLPNNVPTTTNDPDDPEQDGAFWQHMTTFTISIGLKGSIDPITDWPALKTGHKSWPTITTDIAEGSPAKIDDLYHAAVNSRGSFVVASNPEELKNSLLDALSSIAEQPGTGVSLSSSSSIAGAGVRVFQASFVSGAWTGDIIGHATNPTTGALVSSPAPWKASEKLPANWVNRTIYTNVDGALRDFTYAELNSAQKSALNNDANLVDYLSGDRSREGTSNAAGSPGYRMRKGVLGDFVNSTPLYVGPPGSESLMNFRSDFSGRSDYNSYAEGQKNRIKMVYAGSNDGMLHGFNAETGEEVFAFVPNASIMGGMKNLAAKPFEHRYYVDGELASYDVYTNGSWRTVLVGSMGRGGKAVFALDVTNPESINLLWEKSASDIPALGNIIGRPKITQVADGEWRVVLATGPNTTSDRAHLVMIDLANGDVTVVNTDTTINNGLMAVTLADTTGNGFADTAYAGDLRGRMWRITNLGSTPVANVLFTANANGVQPISAEPTITRHPKTGDLWVFFGTGRYLNQGDLPDTSLQSLYGLIDDGTEINSRSDLVKREITTASTISSGDESELEDKRGWYMDLVVKNASQEGERIVGRALLRSKVLWVSTIIPDTSDPCAVSGSGYLMNVSAFSGSRTTTQQIDTNGDNTINDDDKASDGDPTSRNKVPNLDGMPWDLNDVIEQPFDPDTGNGGSNSNCAAANIVDSNGNTNSLCLATSPGDLRVSSWRELLD